MEQEFDRDVAGVDEGDSQELANTSTASAADPGQPTAPVVKTPEKPSKVNLDDIPEFRQWKSNQDKRLSELEQYNRHLMQQIEERETAGMDDYERAQHEIRKLHQQNQYLMQEVQAQQVSAAKHAALNDISRTMNVPMDALMDAQDINEAWRMAARYQQESAQRTAEEQAARALQRQQQRVDKQQRNSVDTGSGSVSGSDYDRQYEVIRNKKDAWSLFNHALSKTQE